jgi:3-methyladenine DNA glycosylase/8-oxoguanine DNA glycosylase
MQPYTVEFVAHESITTMVPMFDAFKFKPKGRAQWLQRLAWRFLNWRGAMDQAYEPKVTVKRHLIDADKFMDRILKQRRSLFDGFRKEGQRLVIGSEDYFELMSEPVIYQHFNFTAAIGMSGRLMGLDVEVVPWMRGAVVMP